MNLQYILVICAYTIGPAYIGWIMSLPKTPDYTVWVNVFYAGVFIMFYILGVILRYHLRVK